MPAEVDLFPTGAEIASHMSFLRMVGLRADLVEAHPHLADAAEVDGRGRLIIALPEHGGYARSVVVAASVSGYVGHWLVAAGFPTTIKTWAWPTEVDDAILTQFLAVVHESASKGSELPSPWRWSESQHSLITEVADLLADGGMEASAVVAGNRIAPDALEGERKLRTIAESFGVALRVTLPWGTATLARKPRLGWVLDANDHLVTRRMDLGQLATGTPSGQPGFECDDPHVLASAVERAAEEQWARTAGHLVSSSLHEVMDDEGASIVSPLHAAAAWWVNELGFGRAIVSGEKRASVDSQLHVHVTQRRVGLGPLKQAFADATIEGKPLIVFADGSGGYTKDARALANRANIPLFSIWGDDYQLRAWSDAARELQPTLL